MLQIGNIAISNQDSEYLVAGLAKLIQAYNADKSSTRDLNFIRQMTMLQKKLEIKLRKHKNQNQ